MNLPTRTRQYFPGLNALRAYAAACVIIHHIELNPREWYGIRGTTNFLEYFALSGWDSVSLFFVLSGFLITYLLLVEKEKHQTIRVKSFYKRRFLRIWPLYYLILGIAAVLALNRFEGTNPRMWVAFERTLGGVLALTISYNVFFGLMNRLTSLINHLWSIGVEEQFYLIYPLIVKAERYLPIPLLVLIAVKYAAQGVVTLLAQQGLVSPYLPLVVAVSRYECMLLGGLFAWVYYTRHPLLAVLYRRPVQWLSLLVIGIAVVQAEVGFNVLHDLLIGTAFGILITNIGTNPQSILHLENAVTRSLGNISYGLYMYHPIVMYLLLGVFRNMPPALIYVTVFAGTIAVSYLSYHFFEKPFLRLKERFAPSPRPAIAVTAP